MKKTALFGILFSAVVIAIITTLYQPQRAAAAAICYDSNKKPIPCTPTPKPTRTNAPKPTHTATPVPVLKATLTPTSMVTSTPLIVLQFQKPSDLLTPTEAATATAVVCVQTKSSDPGAPTGTEVSQSAAVLQPGDSPQQAAPAACSNNLNPGPAAPGNPSPWFFGAGGLVLGSLIGFFFGSRRIFGPGKLGVQPPEIKSPMIGPYNGVAGFPKLPSGIASEDDWEAPAGSGSNAGVQPAGIKNPGIGPYNGTAGFPKLPSGISSEDDWETPVSAPSIHADHIAKLENPDAYNETIGFMKASKMQTGNASTDDWTKQAGNALPTTPAEQAGNTWPTTPAEQAGNTWPTTPAQPGGAGMDMFQKGQDAGYTELGGSRPGSPNSAEMDMFQKGQDAGYTELGGSKPGIPNSGLDGNFQKGNNFHKGSDAGLKNINGDE